MKSGQTFVWELLDGIVIITDSLSTIMAAKSRTPTNNPKKKTIRKMLDHDGPRIILLRPTRQRKKRWTRIYQPLIYPPDEEMVDRRGLKKKRPKMEKTETTR
jgi:hypothetical protein